MEYMHVDGPLMALDGTKLYPEPVRAGLAAAAQSPGKERYDHRQQCQRCRDYEPCDEEARLSKAMPSGDPDAVYAGEIDDDCALGGRAKDEYWPVGGGGQDDYDDEYLFDDEIEAW